MNIRKEKIKVDIISGFLGAGKTTFLNTYLKTISGKVVVLENEFGDVSIDGDLINKDVPVKELYSGCICCSLNTEFKLGIKEIIDIYNPDHIVIEPSGVSKLSEIIRVCIEVKDSLNIEIGRTITIVEAPEFYSYRNDFGNFYEDQIIFSDLIFLSKVNEALNVSEFTNSIEKTNVIDDIEREIRKINETALIFSTDFRSLSISDFKELFKYKDESSYKGQDKISSNVTKNPSFKSSKIKDLEFETLNGAKDFFNKLDLDGGYGNILRIKGYIKIKSDPTNKYLVNLTKAKCEISKVHYETDVRELIIIGQDINIKNLKKFFLRSQYKFSKGSGKKGKYKINNQIK